MMDRLLISMFYMNYRHRTDVMVMRKIGDMLARLGECSRLCARVSRLMSRGMSMNRLNVFEGSANLTVTYVVVMVRFRGYMVWMSNLWLCRTSSRTSMPARSTMMPGMAMPVQLLVTLRMI